MVTKVERKTMTNKNWFAIAAVLGGLSMALCGGCGTTDEDASKLKPEGLPGDYPLGDRTELGTRIAGVNLENVLFDYDSAQIKDSELPKVQAAAKYLIENSNVRGLMEGNCDERGSNEYNMSLGERRGQAVRANLIRLGIDASRLYTKSYGKEKPLDPGHSEAAWRVNRRVEFGMYK
jgi:peptidoglycan-associated lipoprotein